MTERRLALVVVLAFSAAGAELLSRPWGAEFRVRVNEAGDSIAIAAAYADSTRLWLYDMAEGRVVRFDFSGRLLGSVSLQSVGRATYAGDDFVVRGNEFLFLNTVDRRIEVFDAATGSHKKAVPYSTEPLAQEPRRSLRIVNRIFLDSKMVVLGNERRAWHLDESLGKRLSGRAVLKAGAGVRLVGFARGAPVVVKDRPSRKGTPGGGVAAIQSHYPVAGKRVVLINDTLYVLVLEPSGFRIIAAR